MKNWLYSLILILATIKSLSCQSPNFIQYGISDNLPTRQVYELMEDRNGYVWALTDRGIHRFNGSSFDEITICAELHSNLPVDIIEDKSGTIWILFLDGKIGFYNYHSKTIMPHPMNNEIESLTEESIFLKSVLNNSFKLTNDGGLTLSYFNRFCLIVYPDRIEKIEFLKDAPVQMIKVHEVGLLAISLKKHKYEKIIIGSTLKLNLYGNIHTLNVKENERIVSGGSKNHFTKEKSGDYIIIGNTLIKTKNNSIENLKVFEFVILGIKELNQGELMVFQTGRSPVIIDPVSFMFIRESKLPFSFVTHCIKDSEGGVWFSTLYDGIIHIPPVSFSHYNWTKNKQISALHWEEERLYYGTLEGEVGYIENEINHTIIEANLETPIQTFFWQKNTLNILTEAKLIQSKNNRIISHFPKNYILPNYSDFLLASDTLFLTGHTGLRWIYNRELYYNQKLIISKQNNYNRIRELDFIHELNSICKWNGKIIGASNNQILLLNTYSHSFDTLFTLNQPIKKVRSNGKDIILASKEGVYWVDPINKKAQLVLDLKKCFANHISFVENVVWISTTNGLYGIQLDSENFNFQINNFQLAKSYENINYKTTAFSKEKLFLGTSNGIYEIPITDLYTEKNNVKIYLSKVKNQGREINQKQHSEFSYEENNMSFQLDLLNTKDRSDIQIYYRLINSENWRKTTSTKIELPFLPPNTYQFQAKACLNDECSETKTYLFTINAPFWKRTSVQIVTVLILLLSMFSAYRWRLKKIQKEQTAVNQIVQLEKTATELHQKALFAQMNPHFMFNALNSIQSFILKNTSAKSEKYLSDFAHLMRLVLESSIDQNIEIDKEIRLLKSYLSLEQLRLDFSFDFSINCDESLLDEGLKIPTMILQPLVENAIEHGIKNNRNGKIKITIQDCDTFVNCTVMDNGGNQSKKSKEFDGLYYESRATNIIADRIKILQIDHNKTAIKYKDLTENDAKGTSVEVILPLLD